jgi:hypothetical protein
MRQFKKIRETSPQVGKGSTKEWRFITMKRFVSIILYHNA